MLPAVRRRTRRRRSSGRLSSALVLSLGAHVFAMACLEWLQPEAAPLIMVQKEGEGDGLVVSIPDGILCGAECGLEFERGSRVSLVATVGTGSTFEGWEGPCGPETPRLLRWAHDVLLEGASYEQVEANPQLYSFLDKATGFDLGDDPRRCELWAEDRQTRIVARFGRVPDSQEVAFIQTEALEDIDLPELAEPESKTPPTTPPTPPSAQQASKENLQSVELPDQDQVDTAPDDAKFLSDKNRMVKKETASEDTNMQKEMTGETQASTDSKQNTETPGGDEDVVADLEQEDGPEEDSRAEGSPAIGVVPDSALPKPDQAGAEPVEDSPLAMRGIEGRGAPGSDSIEAGELPLSGQLKTQLTFDDYQRILGDGGAAKERKKAKKKLSRRRGRWERKMGVIRSALENFTPEVRPGNQTALNTRAAPFAVFLTRMHRSFHDRWWGFLGSLSRRSSSDPINNWGILTKVEVILNPDGSIEKTNIAKGSGVLAFDVAAIDVLMSAEPFEPPPEAIRSKDGKTYIHWRFHRDQRGCGTYGADPFILE